MDPKFHDWSHICNNKRYTDEQQEQGLPFFASEWTADRVNLRDLEDKKPIVDPAVTHEKYLTIK